MISNNFKKAFALIKKYEGGYVNDPNDSGKETFMGISRRYHPKWKGWQIIDSLKKNKTNKDFKGFSKELLRNKKLLFLVKEFYYNEYWEEFNGDNLPYKVALELLEQSILLGNWKTAGKQLQTALNYLNKGGIVFNDLTIDGIVGPKTLKAVKRVDKRLLIKVLNGLEFCRLKRSMDKSKKNRKYIGWFSRV